MQTEALFKDIAERIRLELEQAEHRISQERLAEITAVIWEIYNVVRRMLR
ncbi:hypothetical protein QJS82_05185 [Psychrobacter maritimus]|nr:hypothetical protein [Psychrobacter sp. WB2]WGV14066.1 hypothetical protein QJS82_05185 [Psychrobacter sp. WB2]